MKKLALAISALCLLEALCYFWSGWSAFLLFRSAGATPAQSLYPLQGEWTTAVLILTAGILHWVAPRLRLPLAVAGVFGGFYGAYYLLRSRQLLGWDILHDGIIAAGKWSEVLYIALGVFCVIELALFTAKDTR